MRVAIIQEFIPPYREGFFLGLSRDPDIDMTMYLNTPNPNLNCRQVEVKNRSFYRLLHTSVGIDQFRGYDCVVMTFDLQWTLLYRLLAQNKNVVLWGHGMGSKAGLASIKTVLVRRSAGFIAYERAGAEFFSVRGVEKAKLAYMGNTVSVSDHHLSEKPRDYFIYVGRLQRRKRLDQLIRAYAVLPGRLREKAGLLFLGDGDIKADLESLAGDLGLNRECKFLPGSYDGDVVRSYLEKAVAYVSPGHVGLGVMHAFAYGVPVITFRDARHAPEVCNIKDGCNGLLVDESEDALARALAYYLTNPEKHTDHCAAAHRHYANERTIEMMIDRFRTALQNFMQAAK